MLSARSRRHVRPRRRPQLARQDAPTAQLAGHIHPPGADRSTFLHVGRSLASVATLGSARRGLDVKTPPRPSSPTTSTHQMYTSAAPPQVPNPAHQDSPFSNRERGHEDVLRHYGCRTLAAASLGHTRNLCRPRSSLIRRPRLSLANDAAGRRCRCFSPTHVRPAQAAFLAYSSSWEMSRSISSGSSMCCSTCPHLT